MTSPTTDRRFGLVGNTPFKAPVTVAATGSLTLSGEQTVDGVAVKALNAAGRPDRVLALFQADSTTNGIYDVSTAAWTRSLDADGNYDLANGSLVLAARGGQAGQVFRCGASDPVLPGSSTMPWFAEFAAATYPVIPTIASLKALSSAVTSRAFVLGYYAAGDGGGGLYWYDSTDVASADNGGTIIVAADGGRWKLFATTFVSCKQFGAKGDGATNDYQAIQNWLDTTTIHMHYAPAGRYINSTATWSVNRASVSLMGDAPCGQGAVTGNAITEFVANGPAVLMRWGDPTETSVDGAHINAGGAIRNIAFSGSVASTSGLRIYNITVHIEDNYFSNVVAGGGIGCWMAKGWGSTLTRNVFQSNAAVDLQLETANNEVGIYDNRFLSNTASNGLFIKGGQNTITVINNDFEGKLNGMKIDTSGATLENLTMIGNNFESNANRGILHVGGSNIIGLTIESGRHNAANDGIDLDTVIGGRVDRLNLNACNLNVNTAASVIAVGRSMNLSGGAAYTGQVGALKFEASNDYLYEDNPTIGALAYTLDASLYNELDLNLTAACTGVTFTINNAASRPRGARLSIRVGNSTTATAGAAIAMPASVKKNNAGAFVIPASTKKSTINLEKDANGNWFEYTGRSVDAA